MPADQENFEPPQRPKQESRFDRLNNKKTPIVQFPAERDPFGDEFAKKYVSAVVVLSKDSPDNNWEFQVPRVVVDMEEHEVLDEVLAMGNVLKEFFSYDGDQDEKSELQPYPKSFVILATDDLRNKAEQMKSDYIKVVEIDENPHVRFNLGIDDSITANPTSRSLDFDSLDIVHERIDAFTNFLNESIRDNSIFDQRDSNG